MKRITANNLFMILLSGIMVISCNKSKRINNELYTIDLSAMKQVAEVDERYQSVNVEMCEIVGGDFWIPYELLDPSKMRTEGMSALKRTIPPVDLYEEKIRMIPGPITGLLCSGADSWALQYMVPV